MHMKVYLAVAENVLRLQSLRAEHGKRYKGRSLQMAARVGEGHDIELVGTDEKLDGLTIHLSLMEGEPTTSDGKPLEDGMRTMQEHVICTLPWADTPLRQVTN
jgi:hypothetical protein